MINETPIILAGSRVLSVEDSGYRLVYSGAINITLTIPVGLPFGFGCEIFQVGQGTITLDGGTEISIPPPLETMGKSSSIGLLSLSGDTYATRVLSPAGEGGGAGAAGPPGPQGPAGPPGPQGVQGVPGETGATGSQGVAGPQGPTGAAGPAGPEGAAGAQGVQGSAGPAGPEGPPGPQGVPGETGATGAAGSTGPQGPTGPEGPQGATGPAGPTGPSGLAADGSVTTVKLADGAVTPQKLDRAYVPVAEKGAVNGVATLSATGKVLAAQLPAQAISLVCGDEVTSLTTGVSKHTFRMPYAMTLTKVKASLSTASTSGITTVDVNKNGTSLFSTVLTFDVSEKTTATAAVSAVLTTTALADDDQITVDIDVSGTGAKGLKVYLIGTL